MNLAGRLLNKLTAAAAQANPDLRDPRTLEKVRSDSLLFYYGNVHSQRGQDGILAEVFRRLGITSGRFVEFGAWDGVYLSNSRFLYEKGWGGIFIEGNAGKFHQLKDRYDEAAGVRCINAMVGTETGERLADLVGETSDITFVSIDIDGNDLEVLANLGFTPPVVLMEGGFNFSPLLTTPVPTAVAADNLGQPIAVICKRARELGYSVVCFYQDVFLVRTDIAGGLQDLEPATLFRDAFNFMPISYRESLLDLRRKSMTIQKYERDFFGTFQIDPLSY